MSYFRRWSWISTPSRSRPTPKKQRPRTTCHSLWSTLSCSFWLTKRKEMECCLVRAWTVGTHWQQWIIIWCARLSFTWVCSSTISTTRRKLTRIFLLRKSERGNYLVLIIREGDSAHLLAVKRSISIRKRWLIASSDSATPRPTASL